MHMGIQVYHYTYQYRDTVCMFQINVTVSLVRKTVELIKVSLIYRHGRTTTETKAIKHLIASGDMYIYMYV